MPSGRQVGAFLAVWVPVMVASALALGGFHNVPLAIACLAVTALAVICGVLYRPLRRRYLRRTGWSPVRAWHTLIGNGALLRLDLGTEAGITSVACELHVPHYRWVGGIPKATAHWNPNPSDRVVTFLFPQDFGLAPIFGQFRVLGWYPVNWIITQNGSARVVTDRFRIGTYSFVSAFRDAWGHRSDGEARFWRWLAKSLLLQFLRFTRLMRLEFVQRAWLRIFPLGQIGPITLAIGMAGGVRRSRKRSQGAGSTRPRTGPTTPEAESASTTAAGDSPVLVADLTFVKGAAGRAYSGLADWGYKHEPRTGDHVMVTDGTQEPAEAVIDEIQTDGTIVLTVLER
jgi:hypothetical protein